MTLAPTSTSILAPLQPQPQQQPRDYPAAHSMDTSWYAVDANGELGEFMTGEEGLIPMLPGAPAQDREAPHIVGWNHNQPPGLSSVVSPTTGQKLGEVELKHDVPEQPAFHRFYVDDDGSAYVWNGSPRRALTLGDLPAEYRGDQHLIHLKDYVFASRAPVDPMDHAPNCYGYAGMGYANAAGVQLPHPNLHGGWRLADQASAHAHYNFHTAATFFAVDDDGQVALFIAHGPGALPVQLPAAQGMEPWKKFLARANELPASHPQHPLELLPPALGPADFARGKDPGLKLPFLALMPPGKAKHFTLFERLPVGLAELSVVIEEFKGGVPKAFAQGQILLAWPGGPGAARGTAWWRHWLDYTTGLLPPGKFGFYHYAMTWHQAAPYLRINVPERPLQLAELDPKLSVGMDVVRLRGVRFAAMPRVQPCMHCQCDTGRAVSNREYIESEIWIDEALTAVRLCTPESVRHDDDERVLRHARAHVALIEALDQ